MAKPEWGTKRVCAACGARFYDLKKDPIICPKCETVFDPEAGIRLKRSRSSQTADAKAKAAAAAKAEAAKNAAAEKDDASDDDVDLGDDVDIEDVADDEDDSVLEDASDLSDDDDLDEIAGGVEKEKDTE